jgi:hypothetical protein
VLFRVDYREPTGHLPAVMQILTHPIAATLMAQSIGCHPEWDTETHLAWFESEGYDLEQPITVVRWPNGPITAALREYVTNWAKHPERFRDLIARITAR